MNDSTNSYASVHSTTDNSKLPAASLLQQIVELHQKLDDQHSTIESLQSVIKTLLRANLDLSNDLQAARSAIVFLSNNTQLELDSENREDEVSATEQNNENATGLEEEDDDN